MSLSYILTADTSGKLSFNDSIVNTAPAGFFLVTRWRLT
jgi:hypothetical protein